MLAANDTQHIKKGLTLVCRAFFSSEFRLQLVYYNLYTIDLKAILPRFLTLSSHSLVDFLFIRFTILFI